ncbi:MAG: pyridoxamine 5'-phosphate oxidase family protein, partial [Calditrichaeota bacterium]|nr:pyridoxamine 5'-phosphate oxidase family protein [Calditrichota bacterium]
MPYKNAPTTLAQPVDYQIFSSFSVVFWVHLSVKLRISLRKNHDFSKRGSMGDYQHESWDSFDEILQKCFGMLETGVSDRRDPLHTPVIGTVENNAPQLRTVIFRKFDPASRTLIFHTDFRTEKVAQIQNNPVVSWLFYHPERKVQLRIISDAKIHSDDSIADERWAASQLMSRRCYCIPMAPGTLSDSPESGLPEYLQLRRPTESESNDLG